MFNVTEAACALVSEMLRESEVPEGKVARIVRSGDGFSLATDDVQDDDLTFEHDGKPVLAITQEVSGLVDDRTLDVQPTVDGPQLAFSSADEEA